MKQLYAFFLFTFLLFGAAQAQGPATPQMLTPCVVLEKLVVDFPNNFSNYLGDEMEVDMFSQHDARFASKINLPGSRDAYFYNEVYKKENIFYTKFYEGPDSALANGEFIKWRNKIEGCTTLPFGSLASSQSEDELEKKIIWYPFDVVGEMEKKYGNIKIEFKIFKWSKMKPTGQFESVYTLDMKILSAQ